MADSSAKRDGQADPTRLAETQLRKLLDTLPVSAYTCDAAGLITYFNARAVDIWQRAPKLNDPIDRYCGSLRLFAVDGTPIAHDRCWMALALTTGEEQNGHEIVIERNDLSRVTVLAHASPLRDSAGRVVGAMNLLVDITDRKRAEDAQALLAAIVESSDDAITSKTLDGTITSWNGGAERLYGYPAAEAIGRSIMIIVPHDRSAEELAILECIRRGERVDHSETMRVAKDGRLIEVSITVSPVRDHSGRIIGASAVTRDITARKLAEEALQSSEHRFHMLADNMAQLAWIADESGAINWYNKRWHDFTGTTPQEMAGWGWQKVHSADHIERVMARYVRCVQTGEVWEDTFPLRSRTGEYRWFLSRAVPIRDATGRVVRWFGTNTDITAKREAENALRDADRRKDEFLAMLAHELRNPLAPIRNSLHIMRLAEDLDPSMDKVREILERQTDHLVRLVDDLLEVSRITLGKIELRAELIELAAVIRGAVETSRPLLDAGRHQLAISLPAEPMMLNADATRLAQVVANLVNNAAKFTPEGGQIWLTAEPIGREAVIRVRDNGIGIAPDMLSTIFEKFAQASESRPHGGLGIGLTLAQSLVQLHGGTIEAQSDGLGRGSQFTVRLPLVACEAPSAPARAAVASAPACPGCKVLVVDDTRDSSFILSKLLEALGHQVFTADNGRKALELALRERPDVVISDIAMAEMDGYELARRLRAEPSQAGVLLVALTGFGHDQDRALAKEAGFDQHVVKPIGMETLQQLFQGRAARERSRT
ncbi:MAG: PAS domain S-box protein [Pirellulales bacterium]